MSARWKRNTVVATMVLLVCAAVALNWKYTGEQAADAVEETGTKILGEATLVSGQEDGGEAGTDEEAVYTGGDYFASARLTRQQARDNAISLLQEAADQSGADAAVANEASEGIQVLALLSKKLLVNSVGMLFDLLGKTGSREAIRAASNYLSTALYQVYRHLYHANPANNPDFFSVSQRHFMAGLANADLHMSEVELTDALSAHVKEKGRMPEMDHAALARDYPVLYQSMLQLIHNSGERINHLMEGREAKGEKKK